MYKRQDISDHIILKYSGDTAIQEIIQNHLDYVSSETLADDVEPALPSDEFYVEKLNIENKEVIIGIRVSA